MTYVLEAVLAQPSPAQQPPHTRAWLSYFSLGQRTAQHTRVTVTTRALGHIIASLQQLPRLVCRGTASGSFWCNTVIIHGKAVSVYVRAARGNEARPARVAAAAALACRNRSRCRPARTATCQAGQVASRGSGRPMVLEMKFQSLT